MDDELGNLELEQQPLPDLDSFAEQQQGAVSTGTPQQPNQVQQPSMEGVTKEPWKIPTEESFHNDELFTNPLESGKQILQGTLAGTAEDLAPLVGISDTVIDTINFLSAGDNFDIPKIPE